MFACGKPKMIQDEICECDEEQVEESLNEMLEEEEQTPEEA